MLDTQKQVENNDLKIEDFEKMDQKLPATVYSEILRKNLNDSRRAFLEIDKKEIEKTKKTRKISFKTKNSNRKSVTKQVISASKVQQLTNKYNEIVQNKNLENSKTAKIVKRVNSIKFEKIPEKPIVKPKYIKTENKNVKRKLSFKKSDPKAVKAKITYLESPKIVSKTDEIIKKVNRKISIKKQNSFSQKYKPNVKATIEIFEKNLTSPTEVKKFSFDPKNPNNDDLLKNIGGDPLKKLGAEPVKNLRGLSPKIRDDDKILGSEFQNVKTESPKTLRSKNLGVEPLKSLSRQSPKIIRDEFSKNLDAEHFKNIKIGSPKIIRDEFSKNMGVEPLKNLRSGSPKIIRDEFSKNFGAEHFKNIKIGSPKIIRDEFSKNMGVEPLKNLRSGSPKIIRDEFSKNLGEEPLKNLRSQSPKIITDEFSKNLGVEPLKNLRSGSPKIIRDESSKKLGSESLQNLRNQSPKFIRDEFSKTLGAEPLKNLKTQSPKIIRDEFSKNIGSDPPKTQKAVNSHPQKNQNAPKYLKFAPENLRIDLKNPESTNLTQKKIFEVSKPKIPEKNVLKTKELVIKDGVRKLKIFEKKSPENEILEKIKTLKNVSTNFEQNDRTNFVMEISKIDILKDTKGVSTKEEFSTNNSNKRLFELQNYFEGKTGRESSKKNLQVFDKENLENTIENTENFSIFNKENLKKSTNVKPHFETKIIFENKNRNIFLKQLITEPKDNLKDDLKIKDSLIKDDFKNDSKVDLDKYSSNNKDFMDDKLNLKVGDLKDYCIKSDLKVKNLELIKDKNHVNDPTESFKDNKRNLKVNDLVKEDIKGEFKVENLKDDLKVKNFKDDVEYLKDSQVKDEREVDDLKVGDLKITDLKVGDLVKVDLKVTDEIKTKDSKILDKPLKYFDSTDLCYDVPKNKFLEKVQPNTSFLWRQKSKEYNLINIAYENCEENFEQIEENIEISENFEDLYDTVDPPEFQKNLEKTDLLQVQKSFLHSKISEDNVSHHSYESFEYTYEKIEMDSENMYEVPKSPDVYYSKESIYETLPSPKQPDNHYESPKSPATPVKSPSPYHKYDSPKNHYEVLCSTEPPESPEIQKKISPEVQNRKLPRRPDSIYKEDSLRLDNISNCYESIYNSSLSEDYKKNTKNRFSVPDMESKNLLKNRLSVPNQLDPFRGRLDTPVSTDMNLSMDNNLSWDTNHSRDKNYSWDTNHSRDKNHSWDTNLSRDKNHSWETNLSRDKNLNVDNHHENLSDDECYESISIQKDDSDLSSNRDSVISCDQSNSLYGRYTLGSELSDRSMSDRSDDWVDMSDEEEGGTGFVIVREKTKNRRNVGWSDRVRDQWSKSPKKPNFSDDTHDPSHLYESLNSDDDFDSFDSDSEDESFAKINQNDSGVDMGNCQLPDPPNSSNIYSLTHLAQKAGKQMKKLRRNWSLTKNDITKSLSRINLMKSNTNLSTENSKMDEKSKIKISKPVSNPENQNPRNSFIYSPPNAINSVLKNESPNTESPKMSGSPTENSPKSSPKNEVEEREKRNSLGRKKNWLKFRRSTSMVESTTLPNTSLTKPSSTFYLTDVIDVDRPETPNTTRHMSIDDPKPVVPLRRRSKNVAVRPQSPPPPTPADKKISKKSSRGTSWYAEVGLFKNSSPPVITPPVPPSSPQKPPNTCWYAEIGLYQPQPQINSPGTSSGENSGSSFQEIKENDSSKIYLKNERNSLLRDHISDDISELNSDYDAVEVRNSNYINFNSSTLGRPQSIESHLKNTEEQLYQFYNQAVIDNACRSNNSSSEDSDCDGYEEIGHLQNEAPKIEPKIEPDVKLEKRKSYYYSNRCLWCELPEVKQSQILNLLNPSQKKLQEAKFEIITSEVSYLKSLHLLENHFMKSLENDFVSKEDWEILFGRVRSVTECSEKLLADLESCWQENILLLGIGDVILKYAQEYFKVYISYCENQVFLDQTLKKLKDKKAFGEVLKNLESSPDCQLLTLYSFLMLPMQRVTRLPLLVDAVLKRLNTNDEEYPSCQKALISLNQLVQQCNEAARIAERTSESARVLNQLEFPPTVPPLPIVGNIPRYLVRSGELTQLISRGDDAKLTIGKKFAKLQIHLFLFEDILVIGKKKSEDKYGVIHHCSRNFLELTEDTLSQLPVKESQGKHLLFLTLLENQELKTVEMLLMCSSETDKQRWQEAFSPPKSTNPDEVLYESWDCPQVTAIHFYTTSQPDELNLVIGDVVNVTKKMADGWYYGERIKDGTSGWFPGNHTQEIANKHVRARNLKQRYRLLTFTGNILNKSNTTQK